MKHRTRYITYAILLGAVLLSACTGSLGSNSWPGVSATQDTVYLAYSTGVFSIRISDGSLVWRYPAKADNKLQFYASPTLVGNLVIVGDYAGTLSAINAQTGENQWDFTKATGRWIASVSEVDDTILAPSADENLYALDMQGNLKWTFDQSKQALWAQPVSDGTYVYQGSMDHTLYAINLQNGTEAWKMELNGAIVYKPALQDGILYVATLADDVVAIRTSDHKLLWDFTTNGEVWGSPQVVQNVVYFADLTGTIFAVDAQTGAQKWKVEAGSPVAGSLAVTPSGIVAATESGDVIFLDFAGTKLYTRNINGTIYGNMAVGPDQVIVAITGGDNLLTAFDFQGNQIWTFVPPK